METSDPTRYENPVATEQSAIVSNQEAASLPQPVDYGLTYEETFNGLYLSNGQFRDELPESRLSNFKYKQGEWVSFYSVCALMIWFPLYLIAFVIFTLLNPNIPGGGWTWSNANAIKLFFLLLLMPGFFPGFPIVCAVVQGRITAHKQKRPSADLLAFRKALREHKSYLAAAREAEQAEQALLRQKRSYWDCLNGYEFEVATAEVLERHQFNPKVTGRSADGGVDIEVTREGQKGVVQCKAHVACVGPHTVRDLFGVIHHSGADFGMIVSLGGFTKGAIEFASNKPIFWVDSSDLIAMQEGQDVLAGRFTRSRDT